MTARLKKLLELDEYVREVGVQARWAAWRRRMRAKFRAAVGAYGRYVVQVER